MMYSGITITANIKKSLTRYVIRQRGQHGRRLEDLRHNRKCTDLAEMKMNIDGQDIRVRLSILVTVKRIVTYLLTDRCCH